MASLNTLRTRGGVIVSIVITLALVAFLLGDFMGGSNASPADTKIGEINGTKINIVEYSNLTDKYSEVIKVSSGKEQLTNELQEQSRTMAWEDLMMKNSFIPGMTKLGITISQEEQIDMVSGSYISPVLSAFFSDSNTGALSAENLKNFMSNVRQDTSGKLRLFWNSTEEQMNYERLMTKLFTLVSKGAFVTDLEQEYGIQEANNIYGARFVSQPYDLIADSTVKVEQSKIKKYYNDNKKKFKQSESRGIEYVVFQMLPSDEDMAAAGVQINEIAEEFLVAENPMQYAYLNSQVKPNAKYLKVSEIDPKIAEALVANKGAMYGPILSGDTYTIARLGEPKSLPDSIGARQIQLDLTATALADSLLTVLKSGKATFEEIALQYSIDPQAKVDGGDIGVFAPGDDELSKKALALNKGDFFTMAMPSSLHIVQLTSKTAPQTKMQVAQITYKVLPSDATQQDVYGQASRFLAATNDSSDNFQKTANEMALAKRVAHIGDKDRTVNSMENSNGLVNWAFNNKKGAVSSILEVMGDYIIAVLVDVKQEGTTPLEQVTLEINSELTRQKKADILSARMVGSSLDQVAATLSKEVSQAEGVQYASFFVEGAGVEPKLVGAICGGVAQGKLSKPVKGVYGVYLFEVTSVGQSENPVTKEDFVMRADAMNNYSSQDGIYKALVDGSAVKDYRARYF